MMYSIDDASLILPKAGYVHIGAGSANALAAGMFYLVMLCDLNEDNVQGDIFLIAVGLAAALGLVLGLYIKYRAEFSPVYSIVMQHYFIRLASIFSQGLGRILSHP